MIARDNGPIWIEEYCVKEEITYPGWLGGHMKDLPRHMGGNGNAYRAKFFSIPLSPGEDRDEWSRCIIWIIENLEGKWCATADEIWLELEEDVVAFKLGCL